jgi:DNA-binding transcriptional LysR family regulator
MMTVPVNGPIEVNSPVATKNAALAGLGFSMLPVFIAEEEIERGRLVACLDEFIVKDGGIYAVYPHRRYLPAKIRALVDFLTQWFKDREQNTSTKPQTS